MNIAKLLRTAFYIEHLYWLLGNSNLILATQILTKAKRSYLYIMIIAKQTKQILPKRCCFFSYIVNINANLKKIDEKKCCFKRI